MIIADHISKVFDKKIVLNDVSFAVNAGEITAVIGLNGSGKTTLLKIIAGMLEADSGYIRVARKNPTELQNKSILGYMDNKQSNLPESINVRAAFELCKKMYHVPIDYYNHVLDYAGQQLGIQEFGEKYKNELSPGEAAKAEFLYTLLIRPDLWIMDEPTIGVDYESRLKMYELIRYFNLGEKEKKMTILVATHNLQEMECLCEKVLVLHDGQIIFRGELEWLQEKYKSLGTICFEIVSGAIYVQDMPLKQYWIDGNKVRILYDKRYVSAVVIIKQLLETAKLQNISITDMDMETMIKSVFVRKVE